MPTFALDLDDAVLVGGSQGASTIWACYDLFGRDRIGAVVTIDQTPRMVNGAGWDPGFYGLNSGNVGTFFDGGIPDTGRGLRRPRTAAAATNPLASVVTLEECGHAANLDQPVATNAAILEVLA